MSDSRARLSIIQAAMVIARRDFVAVLFSKAFFFFLIGPLFFLGISAVGGVLGAKAAVSADPPALAVALPAPDSAAFVIAHDRLAQLTRMPDLAVSPAYTTAAPDALLESQDRNIAAVLAGSLAQPRLIGPQEQIDSWRGEVALTIATANGTAATQYPVIALQPTQTSVADQRSSKSAIGLATIAMRSPARRSLSRCPLSSPGRRISSRLNPAFARSLSTSPFTRR